VRDDLLEHGIHLIQMTTYTKYDPLITILLIGAIILFFLGLVTMAIYPDPIAIGIMVGLLVIIPFLAFCSRGQKAEYSEYKVYIHDDCDWDYIYHRFDVLENADHIYKLRDKGVTDTRGYIRSIGD